LYLDTRNKSKDVQTNKQMGGRSVSRLAGSANRKASRKTGYDDASYESKTRPEK
jgi:hypothetical protein